MEGGRKAFAFRDTTGYLTTLDMSSWPPKPAGITGVWIIGVKP
jgi:hypothetical protein